MAQLSSEDRARVRRGLARYMSRERQGCGLTKAQWLAAVNATDVWIDDNQASYNNALPAVAQSGLTAAQKTLLFCAVATARISIAFLRRVFGEVD